jgi:hypothetical protein
MPCIGRSLELSGLRNAGQFKLPLPAKVPEAGASEANAGHWRTGCRRARVAGETTSAERRPKLSGFVLFSHRAASIAAHSAGDAVIVLQDELRMRQARFSTKSAS